MSGGACAKVIINSAAAETADKFKSRQATFEKLMGLDAVNEGDMIKAGEIDKAAGRALERACDEYELLNQAVADREEAP